MRVMSWMGGAVLAGAMLAAPQAAMAWSNQGHMVTGAIAYDDLAKTDPALVARIETLMASHPDKARFERGLAGYAAEARTRRLFALMARWPDDAREGPYDHPAWHYWLRLIPSKADPIKVPPQLLATTTGEAGEAYRLNLATVHDAYAPAAERAVALCWVFHLAGDIQQPLHAGHLISGRFPLSDQAGGKAFVRPTAGADGVNLHQYWDDAIGSDGDDDANVEAVRLRLENAWSRPALKELDGKADADAFHAWADESLELGRTVVYSDGTFEGAAKATSAEPPPPGYEASRRRVGERRIALGGHRVADAVRAAFAP
jgi:hypothetical protein